TKVTEDPGTGGAYLAYQTTYVYDALDNLRKVTQGTQERYFMYDSLSHLIRAKNPEQDSNSLLDMTDSTTSHSQWAIAYSYDADGNLTQRKTSRGTTSSSYVITTS